MGTDSVTDPVLGAVTVSIFTTAVPLLRRTLWFVRLHVLPLAQAGSRAGFWTLSLSPWRQRCSHSAQSQPPSTWTGRRRSGQGTSAPERCSAARGPGRCFPPGARRSCRGRHRVRGGWFKPRRGKPTRSSLGAENAKRGRRWDFQKGVWYSEYNPTGTTTRVFFIMETLSK